MARARRARGWEARTVSKPALSVKSFFEKILPAKLLASSSAYRALSGKICFVIYGVGTWTVTFGRSDPSMAVERQSVSFDGDLVAGFRPDVFENFLSGVEVVPEKGCYFEGDIRLLEKLGRLIQPAAQGVVSFRARAV